MSNKKLFYIIFAVVFAANIFNTNITAWDSRWTIHTAYSMIYERNIDLDEYSNVIQKHENYGIWKNTEHVYNYFPIGVSILALPFVFVGEYVFELLLIINPDIKTHLQEKGFTLINVTNYYYVVEYFIASLIVALCACFCFLIARRFINVKHAMILTFIFAFCTSLWSVAGRALWMHGPLMLFLLITIYYLTSEKLSVKRVIELGIMLSFTFIIRPTGLIFYFAILLYFILTNKKFAVIYLVSGLAVFAGFFILNYSIYGTIFSPYYQYYVNILSDAGHPNFFEAFAGNMFSPGKGLLIFTPVLIFSAIGIYIKIKMKSFNKLDFILLTIFILYYISISLVTKWWDGWSFGPRYISDVLPILIYFIIPYFSYPEFFKNRKAMDILLAVLITISFLIHTRGALDVKVWIEWNGKPNDIDTHPERMWDWKDPPFLR
ncbi:MAG: hypothetical protein JST55_10085 [Bacteroidetes bacterium]|nr:hypothetical protein [Bacteroidota bacterium]